MKQQQSLLFNTIGLILAGNSQMTLSYELEILFESNILISLQENVITYPVTIL